MKLKSKPFRIAVAGATTDGRVIEGDWLKQMAANYNPEKYMARINCEHFRGILPNGEFKAFGNVVALTTETVKIDDEDKLALMATIEPTTDLIELNRKGQKIFTSMEVDTSFADSDEAYLVGLAVTDSPASLGTEMLQFAAGQKDNNPLADRKQKPENLFSAATEVDLEFADESTLVDRLKELFKSNKKQQNQQDDKNEDFSEAVAVLSSEYNFISNGFIIESMFDEAYEPADRVIDRTSQRRALDGIGRSDVTSFLEAAVSDTDLIDVRNVP